jgi:hypothetical protein
MYENSGDDQMLLEGPSQCWWCKGFFDERRMYPDMPTAIDLHGITFGGVVHRFDDDEARGVCHRCMALFYRWSEMRRSEVVAQHGM